MVLIFTRITIILITKLEPENMHIIDLMRRMKAEVTRGRI